MEAMLSPPPQYHQFEFQETSSHPNSALCPSNLTPPHPLPEFIPPDVSGNTEFTDVFRKTATYVIENQPSLMETVNYAGLLPSRLTYVYTLATAIYGEEGSLEEAQITDLQKERNIAVRGIQTLKKEALAIKEVTKGLEEVDAFLKKTVKTNEAIENKDFAPKEVKVAAEANKIKAQDLLRQLKTIHRLAICYLTSLETSITEAHKKAVTLISCLDMRHGEALPYWLLRNHESSGHFLPLTIKNLP